MYPLGSAEKYTVGSVLSTKNILEPLEQEPRVKWRGAMMGKGKCKGEKRREGP